MLGPGTRGPGTCGSDTRGPGTRGPDTHGSGTRGPGIHGPGTRGLCTKSLRLPALYSVCEWLGMSLRAMETVRDGEIIKQTLLIMAVDCAPQG